MQNDYKSILQSLGYNLQDSGDHWRTQSQYRQGSNDGSLKVYKNSGVWLDYGVDDKPRPFEALVEKIAGKSKAKLLCSSIAKAKHYEYNDKKSALLSMDKIYPESCLESLFPNRSFYNKKNISNNTQSDFKCGLASSGQMYRRITFPIYNDIGQIIGFSGRKIQDASEAAPKWKHIGKKRTWLYPVHLKTLNTDEAITKERSALLVEGIGENLALQEQGIENHICLFGLVPNSKIISYLSSKDLDYIIIAANNDKDKPKNNGFNAAIKSFIKLSNIFDVEKLIIMTPPNEFNDLGEAHENDANLKDWLKIKPSTEVIVNYLHQYMNRKQSLFTQSEIKKINKIYASRS